MGPHCAGRVPVWQRSSQQIRHHPNPWMFCDRPSMPFDVLANLMAQQSAYGDGGRLSQHQQCCPGGHRPKTQRLWRTKVDIPVEIAPENVKVVANGNCLNINAVHVKEADHGCDKYEVTRRVEIPGDVDIETVKTVLIKRGHLVVQGKFKVAKEEDQSCDQGKQGSSAKESKQGLLEFFGVPIDPEHFNEQMQTLVDDVQEILFGNDGKDENKAEKMNKHETHAATPKETQKDSSDRLMSEDAAPSTTGPSSSERSTASDENEDNAEFVIIADDEKRSSEDAGHREAASLYPRLDSDRELQHREDKYPEGQEIKESSVISESGNIAPNCTEIVKDELKSLFSIDVSGYKPDEVSVQVSNNVVKVKGHHEENNDGEIIQFQFQRSFTLPKGVDPESITSTFGAENETLTIASRPADNQ